MSWWLAVLAASAPSWPAPQQASRSHLVRESSLPEVVHETALMGTDLRIVILSEDEAAAREAIAVAEAEMRRIEALMTDWDSQSQLESINRQAGIEPVRVADELLALLEESIELSELTGGKFDVTYAGAGRLWDFRASPPALPDPEQVRAGAARVGYERLVVDREAGTAFLKEAGMRIGLGAIAKGYAVDRAVRLIEARGFEDFAVNAGGDLAARGRKSDSELWWVALQHPRKRGENLAILPMSNVSAVTSGDYERFFELDGRRYCHIIDPDTGWPANGCQSVTVLAPRTYWADALATGVFVMGPTEGLKLLESLAGIEGAIVDSSGELHLTSGLAGR